jgi:hypothetical protein
MKEEVILNMKEQKRLMVLNKLERREVGLAKAAQLLSLSLHHLKRLRADYYQDGAGACEMATGAWASFLTSS